MNHKTLQPERLEELSTLMCESPMEGLEALWGTLLEPKTFDDFETIDPTEYVIPDKQWAQLCQAMIEGAGVSGGLTFVNIGPSSDG